MTKQLLARQMPSRLFATVAASAAPFGSVAVAADMVEPIADPVAIDTRINLAFEVGVLQTDYEQSSLFGEFDKLGETDKLGDTDADIYGSIALSRKFDTDLDWRIAGAYHFGSDNDFGISGDVPGGELQFEEEAKFNFQTVDFDLGKHIQVQNANIRFFGGLRLLHVREKQSWGFSATPDDPSDKSLATDKVGTSDYWGVGPRIGAEGYYALSDRWGLTGSVAAAAMWGRRSNELSFEARAEDPDNIPPVQQFRASQDSDESDVVTNFEFKAGLSWQFLENSALTAGYRVDVWQDLLTQGDDDNQTFHGPFLRVDVKL